ncbi:MAG: tRNA (adenosine(37)-N6)-dimethylallyltransferase MiaA [Butyricicoccus sp.]
MENRLICICGPTASGKTSFSIALAQHLHTEIISADSMQIYRGLDIGTAKPTPEEQVQAVHHMIDFLDPRETFSVARYVEMADDCAQDILSRGMTPIVVGGTGLYLDSLIRCDQFSGDETDLSIREHYQKLAAEQGNEAVHQRLREVDPVSAERLHPNNLKRVIRALEVYEQTGMTIDAFNAQNQRREPKYRAVKFALCPHSRELLYERIDRRVDQMIEDGLLEETRRLYEAGMLVGTAAQAIGYKELTDYLFHGGSLDESVALLKQRSRNYAKRQITWFKRDPEIHWLYYDSASELPDLLQQSTQILRSAGIE